ncbi:MAG: hypothetical protein AAGF59_04310 [Pseudomonadota bacterium]
MTISHSARNRPEAAVPVRHLAIATVIGAVVGCVLGLLLLVTSDNDLLSRLMNSGVTGLMALLYFGSFATTFAVAWFASGLLFSADEKDS